MADPRWRFRLLTTLLLAAAAPLGPAQEPATQTALGPAEERSEPLPPELRNIGIDEHLGAQIPPDLPLVDHAGRPVKIGDYLDGKRPVILTLNYYRCPMLCGLQLNGMVAGLKDMSWVAGDKFQIVTVSFDPLEDHRLAQLKRQNYLKEYGEPAAAAGWHFLTGPKKSIDTLLETTGFRIEWNEERQEWMHVAALVMLTPDGRISRYLYGLDYAPQTLRLSLVEASEGKIGSTVDRILLYCYHYDGEGYTLAAFNIVRAVALLTLLIVGGLVGSFWVRERRRGKAVESTL